MKLIDAGIDQQMRLAYGGRTGGFLSGVCLRRHHLRRSGVARTPGRDTMRRCGR
jgi:hypothetical protein